MTAGALAPVLLAALVLDLALGDPPSWPHPVRWMGRAIQRLEPPLRGCGLTPLAAGRVMVLVLVPGTWLLAAAVVKTAEWISPVLGTGVQIVMLWTCISVRALYSAAMRVEGALLRDDLAAARQSVAMIVGRETDRLDAAAVARAAVETVAENLVDGVLAPLFFALLGGVPMAMAYKMVNTLDSMIGYRNPRYIQFGRTAARLDDLANYLPARLSVPLIVPAAQLLFGRGRPAWHIARRDGRRHASPNAGIPEAAFAGALAVRLGGPNRYHGEMVEKPLIGSGFTDVQVQDIGRACHLMLTTALLAVIAGVGLAFVVG